MSEKKRKKIIVQYIRHHILQHYKQKHWFVQLFFISSWWSIHCIMMHTHEHINILWKLRWTLELNIYYLPFVVYTNLCSSVRYCMHASVRVYAWWSFQVHMTHHAFNCASVRSCASSLLNIRYMWHFCCQIQMHRLHECMWLFSFPVLFVLI